MALFSIFLAIPTAVLATLTINDPSDTIFPQSWATDNAIVPDYNIPFISQQPSNRGYPRRFATQRKDEIRHSG